MRRRAFRLVALVLCVGVAVVVVSGMKRSGDQSRAREACLAETKTAYHRCLDHLRFLTIAPELVSAISESCRRNFEEDTAACVVR